MGSTSANLMAGGVLEKKERKVKLSNSGEGIVNPYHQFERDKEIEIKRKKRMWLMRMSSFSKNVVKFRRENSQILERQFEIEIEIERDGEKQILA